MSDDFLSRWSRRKLREGGGEPAVPDEPAADPVAEREPEESDEELLERLGLKHPNEMEPGDDFAAFLRSAVPRRLKTLAYRRLWRSNPTLACVDGLNDYDGDFTGTGVPATGLKTAYRVGRGLLGRISEVTEHHGADVPSEVETSSMQSDAGESGVEAPAEDVPEIGQAPEFAQENVPGGTSRRRMVFRKKG